MAINLRRHEILLGMNASIHVYNLDEGRFRLLLSSLRRTQINSASIVSVCICKRNLNCHILVVSVVWVKFHACICRTSRRPLYCESIGSHQQGAHRHCAVHSLYRQQGVFCRVRTHVLEHNCIHAIWHTHLVWVATYCFMPIFTFTDTYIVIKRVQFCLLCILFQLRSEIDNLRFILLKMHGAVQSVRASVLSRSMYIV